MHKRFLSAGAVLAGKDSALNSRGKQTEPDPEENVRHGLSRALQEGLEFPALGEQLAANAVESTAHFLVRDPNVESLRFADHPVGRDQEAHDLTHHSMGVGTTLPFRSSCDVRPMPEERPGNRLRSNTRQDLC